MDINKVIKISKFLSYVLRHHPDEIDLTLDDAGWVAVDALLNNASKHGKTITFDELKTIVKKNEKKRFEFNDDQTKIRASQGHSIQVDLGYTHQKPPDVRVSLS